MKTERLPIWIWAMIASIVAFWLAVAYVAIHFIVKFW